eukprot:624085-Alexandrium_andersonii.AAC.2
MKLALALACTLRPATAPVLRAPKHAPNTPIATEHADSDRLRPMHQKARVKREFSCPEHALRAHAA